MVRNLRLKPPVRPTTPPQLRLNLDFGTHKQREEYAREVLQQVMQIDAARAQQGFGSAFISEDDKDGAINDELAEVRAEARWRKAQAQTEHVRRTSQMETARSNPERERTEQKHITFHPQPRPRAPHSARPAAASIWADDMKQRPTTSMGTTSDGGGGSTFLTGTNFEERETDRPMNSRMPAPRREERIEIVREDHPPSARIVLSKEEEEEAIKMWERAERTPIFTTMDAAYVDIHMTEAIDRWGDRPATSQAVLERMEGYLNMDEESCRRVEAEAREAEQYQLTLAHYTQKGLPYIARASTDMLGDRLDKMRDSTADKKLRVETLVEKSVQGRASGDERVRATISEAIREDNKVMQKTDIDTGRMIIAPPSAAAIRVSEPGPIQWPQTEIPWQRDALTGDWYRTDKPYHRGDGLSVMKSIDTPQSYVTEGPDGRALVNRVKLTGHTQAFKRRSMVSERRSADGTVKMGGGFVYRSNIPIDPTHPTPSRPKYSHGLFLFPFSNEEATKMIDVGRPDSKSSEGAYDSNIHGGVKLSTIARFPEGAGKQDDFKNHEGVGKRGMSSGSVERQELRPSSRVGSCGSQNRRLSLHNRSSTSDAPGAGTDHKVTLSFS